MKVSCLFYPPECMFLVAQLTDKPGCSERAPEEGKYVGHFVFSLNLLLDTFLISQNVAMCQHFLKS